MLEPKRIKAGALEVAWREHGPADGWPVVLLHGFPFDVASFAGVAPILAAAGARVIVPWLRGFGPTRFLSAQTPRSGQQGALAADLLALMDALHLPRAVLAGYDWGGRAACIVAALWPGRARALVTQNSYNIHDIPRAAQPAPPENEMRHWYQYYFHGERGRAGLHQNRRALCELLWRTWSPTWAFSADDFARTAESFDNPDFVEVVAHSYRHRFGLVPGDPAHAEIERQLETQPPIAVPTISLDGADDGVMSVGGTAHHAGKFTGRHEHRVIPGAGHNIPQEKPLEFAQAVLDVAGWGD